MINGIRLNQKNISPYQRRIRLQEIAGLKISNRDKKILKPRDCECIKEVVSMVQIPMNREFLSSFTLVLTPSRIYYRIIITILVSFNK